MRALARTPARPRPRPAPGERGAALLVVVTALAILTAMGVDLAYNTRVSLRIAANARDELKAECQAESAVAVSRLVLHFQAQLDQMTQAAGTMAARIGTALPQAQASFRLWEIVPIDSTLVDTLLGAAAPAEQAKPGSLFAEARPEPSGGAGSFQARIDDEDRKIDVSQLAALPGSGLPGAQLVRYLEMVRDPQYDFLFDRDDEYGNRWSRTDVAIALKDWVDEDKVTSALTNNLANPFENGFGDENYPYDKGPDRYKAKNARFDSLDELYTVGGVSDAFMAAFRDRLTVYRDVNAPININTSDPREMMLNILVMSNPPGVPQPPLLDPAFPQKLQAAMQLVRPLPFLSMSVGDFAAVVRSFGIQLQSTYTSNPTGATSNAFGTRSTTFTIRGTGKAGDVEKTIEAVVTFDSRAGPLGSDLGRVLHWREE